MDKTTPLQLSSVESRPLVSPQEAAALMVPMMALREIGMTSARAIEEASAPIRASLQTFNGFLTQFMQVAKATVEPFTQVVQAAQQIGDVVRETMEPINQVRAAIAAIPPEQVEALRQIFANLRAELDVELLKDKVGGPAFKLFAKLGFTGLESYMSLPELEYILKLSKTKGRKAVEQRVFRIFKKRRYRLLNSMMDAWWLVPYMRKRKKAVRAAINAHKIRNYELAIPTLLPLIDGLAAEIIGKTAASKRKTIQTKAAAALYHAQEAEVWSECVEQVVRALIYKDYDFQKAKRPPSSVNRHGILHGRVVGYGTELNSYRVILLLNVMVKMLAQQAKKTAAP